jgi:GT2 family glycosyltransferase/2-polyprenyl-3-methyl-5-hydroxy-6-metoxy-1,4-benzoquinol methylase
MDERMPLDPAELSIVIPTRDRWEILRRTLACLDEQTVRGFRVIVVVDGEDQDLPEPPGGVELLQIAKGGPGAARNAAVARVTSSLVLFLGDDMLPAPGLVEAHLARHAAAGNDRVAVLGHVDWHPEVERTSLLNWIDRQDLQFDYPGIVGDDATWGRFYSCNVSLPVALFREVDGFDPDFTYFYEDLDLGYRLGEVGMSLIYERSAVAQHLHSYDEARFLARLRGIAQGEWTMVQKHAWFAPWFAGRFREFEGCEPPSRLWRRTGPAKRADLSWSTTFAKPYLDAYEAEEELDELKRYLGDAYDYDKLAGHLKAVDAEEHDAPDETTFYRTSQAYLYDLTVFAMSGTKRPYRSAIRRLCPPGSRLLDYGCGIGSDGLRLIDAGYQVDFADFDNPSVEYLRWRLKQRGLDATIFDIESPADERRFTSREHDLVYCFDVIEHVEDPVAFLARLESCADLVAVNFLEPREDDVHVHKRLPMKELLAHVTNRGIEHYALHYGRSHFVIYRSQRAGAGQVALGRLRRGYSVATKRGLPA